MTCTNVNVSAICSNVNCEHFVLASGLVHNQLAETEGVNTTSFRFWRPISSQWVQAVLEVLCQPAAVAALCNIGIGTVSNPLPALFFQHVSLGASRADKATSQSSRSLGARCRNSIASCSDEQPHIGNYRLLKTIGKGNFAKVKLARHILTGKEVRQGTAAVQGGRGVGD